MEDRSRNDGGHAFPQSGSDGGFDRTFGMSLREWYAGLAMQAIIQNLSPTTDMSKNLVDVTSGIAFRQADAMITESKKSEE
jgi:hypothetical protein